MKHITLVQVGFGTVGGTLIEQVLDNRARWRETLDLDFVFGAVGGRAGALVAETASGFDDASLRTAVQRRRASGGGAGHHVLEPIADVVRRLTEQGPVIVLDAAAGTETVPALVAGLDGGGGAVLSNKAPLALNLDDEQGTMLWSHAGPNGRLRYEATCGAGLPVISSLRSLLDTGDEVIEIFGTLSGTFGAIFSTVADGVPFSEAVRAAKDQGYTEPDPRDDLSGLDVARKGLILARTMGHEVNLADIEVESLVPESLADGSVEAFLDGLTGIDEDIARRAEKAREVGSALKYVMHLDHRRKITVGLRQVPKATVLGALQGPENIVSMRTQRYDVYPLVVSGPGAGAAVTAAGMVSDMLSLAQVVG